MKVLLDHNVPVQVIAHLSGHLCQTAAQVGWSTLNNGVLLTAAAGQFDVFVTCDQSIVHQQNLHGHAIAVVVIDTNQWPVIKADPGRLALAVDAAMPGTYQTVLYPRPPLRRRPFPPVD